MGNFVQFRTLSGDTEVSETDRPVKLNGTGDTELFRQVKLEGLDPDRGTVLMFQVSGDAGSHLKILRKDGAREHELVDIRMDPAFKQPRSWHEIVPGSLLSEDENHFVARVVAIPAEGEITVSDVVLLYHGKTMP